MVGQRGCRAPAYVPQGGVSDFISETAGFAWNGTSFYETNNSAQSWAAVAPDVAFSDGFAGMDFVSRRVGFVLFDDCRRQSRRLQDSGRRLDLEHLGAVARAEAEPLGRDNQVSLVIRSAKLGRRYP